MLNFNLFRGNVLNFCRPHHRGLLREGGLIEGGLIELLLCYCCFTIFAVIIIIIIIYRHHLFIWGAGGGLEDYPPAPGYI